MLMRGQQLRVAGSAKLARTGIAVTPSESDIASASISWSKLRIASE